ncbi:helix-turn-helix domain-containing protein [Paenibacillus filicis]|uniref:Helix-turn-helix domain-containing protein n=1 Tax=Paenibacillus filicis TaxID=669464 RepID=A0ABU9DF93_9BACL
MEELEELKRRQILHTAKAVFIEKGYIAASMKDIADACSMAKGSIYKVFESKEDLFTAVFEDCHRTMFEQARELDHSRDGAPPMERLRRKIEFQLQYMLENYFFMSEFRELPIIHNEKFIVAWKKKRAALLTWHRDCLHEAYGEQIETYIWDLVALFRGQQREYITYAHQQVIALPMAELAHFCVERIDALVRDMLVRKPQPVLNETTAYFNHINPIDPGTKVRTIDEFLQAVIDKIQELPGADDTRQELLEVSALLREELGRAAPNRTLLRVYMTFLETEVELRSYVRQLNLMVK